MAMTEEEKVARRLIKIVSDLTLDLEQVGAFLGNISPWVAINRISLMAEIAREEKDEFTRRYYDSL